MFGNLHLPTSPGPAPVPGWADYTANRIFVVVGIFLGLLALRDYFRLWPLLLGCVVRSRGNIEIEHSVSQSRNRNRCAWASLPLFAITADRLNLYPAGFVAALPAQARIATIMGVILAYLLVRYLINLVLKPRRLDSESSSAAHQALANYFLAILPFFMVTAWTLSIFVAQAPVTRVLLWAELAIGLVLLLLRVGQILLSKYSPFKTFLYLCGLELLPLAALVATAAIL